MAEEENPAATAYDPTNSRYIIAQRDGPLAAVLADDPEFGSNSENPYAETDIKTSGDGSSSSDKEHGNVFEGLFASIGHFFNPLVHLWHELADKKPTDAPTSPPPIAAVETSATQPPYHDQVGSTVSVTGQSVAVAPVTMATPNTHLASIEHVTMAPPSTHLLASIAHVDPTPKPHPEAHHKYRHYEKLPAPPQAQSPVQTSDKAFPQISPKILNNPGNLRFNGDVWIGMFVPLDRKLQANDYLAFDTIEHGLRAMAINLRNQQDMAHLNTIETIIAKYAPKSDGAQTEIYINHVSEWMSDNLKKDIKRNTPLDLHDAATLNAFMAAIVRQENGVKTPYSDKQILAAVYDALEAPIGGAPPKTVVARSNQKPSAPQKTSPINLATFTTVPTDHAGVLKVLQAFVNPNDPVDLNHLDPEFAKDLAAKCIAMSKVEDGKYNGKFYLLSTLRDEEKQRRLYEQAKIYKNGKWTGALTHPVAQPGHSAHEGGAVKGQSIAADFQFTGDARHAYAFYRDILRKSIGDFGLETVPNDANHVQLQGANELVAERLEPKKPATATQVASAHPPATRGPRATRTALRHQSHSTVVAEVPSPSHPSANGKHDTKKEPVVS